MFNQLLDLSKLEAGELHLHIRLTDLVVFVRQLVETFSSMADARRVT